MTSKIIGIGRISYTYNTNQTCRQDLEKNEIDTKNQLFILVQKGTEASMYIFGESGLPKFKSNDLSKPALDFKISRDGLMIPMQGGGFGMETNTCIVFDELHLFTNSEKITPEIAQYFQAIETTRKPGVGALQPNPMWEGNPALRELKLEEYLLGHTGKWNDKKNEKLAELANVAGINVDEDLPALFNERRPQKLFYFHLPQTLRPPQCQFFKIPVIDNDNQNLALVKLLNGLLADDVQRSLLRQLFATNLVLSSLNQYSEVDTEFIREMAKPTAEQEQSNEQKQLAQLLAKQQGLETQVNKVTTDNLGKQVEAWKTFANPALFRATISTLKAQTENNEINQEKNALTKQVNELKLDEVEWQITELETKIGEWNEIVKEINTQKRILLKTIEAYAATLKKKAKSSGKTPAPTTAAPAPKPNKNKESPVAVLEQSMEQIVKELGVLIGKEAGLLKEFNTYKAKLEKEKQVIERQIAALQVAIAAKGPQVSESAKKLLQSFLEANNDKVKVIVKNNVDMTEVMKGLREYLRGTYKGVPIPKFTMDGIEYFMSYLYKLEPAGKTIDLCMNNLLWYMLE